MSLFGSNLLPVNRCAMMEGKISDYVWLSECNPHEFDPLKAERLDLWTDEMQLDFSSCRIMTSQIMSTSLGDATRG